MKSFYLCLCLLSTLVQAGILDPDCNAQKAMKSTAMNATIGIEGRCSAKDAAKDTLADNTKIDEKIEKINEAKEMASDKKSNIDDLIEEKNK